MNGRLFLFALVTVACGQTVTGCVSRSYAQGPKQDPQDRHVQLTVYKNDFAMVHEDREVSLNEGSNDVRLDAISDKLDPSSVLFTWAHPGAAEVVSDTYNLGFADGQSLLKRYVGQPVSVVRYDQNGHAADQTDGVLEMANADQVILKSGNRYLVNPPGTLVTKERADIVPASQLSIGVQSPAAQTTSVGVAYLTSGLSWDADYIAHIDPVKDTADIECWATVTNHTGITFPKATIKLVAGAANRAVKTPLHAANGADIGGERMKLDAPMADVTSGFSTRPEATGELYAYPVELPATIAPEEMNRLRLLSSQSVPIQKDYSVRISTNPFVTEPIRQNATLTVNFTNSLASHLGQPLPAGTARAYESNQYVGSAEITDTPKDRLVSLTLSNVFDVTSETRVTQARKLDKHHVAITYAVTLANAKAAPLTVRVVSGFYGTVQFGAESIKSRHLTSGDRQWMVPVPANGHTVLTYTVVMPA